MAVIGWYQLTLYSKPNGKQHYQNSGPYGYTVWVRSDAERDALLAWYGTIHAASATFLPLVDLQEVERPTRPSAFFPAVAWTSYRAFMLDYVEGDYLR
jgi:hypothetical protein